MKKTTERSARIFIESLEEGAMEEHEGQADVKSVI